jgi:peptidoglycan/LPS O-acetylase OafA/YrhL
MHRPVSYRPDIDGMRAIAVLGVLWYHIDPGTLGGGFVGVDVFFVISGFLITSLMIRDLGRDTFSIAGFYERRIRRILPALFCMMIVCIAAAWLLLLPQQMIDFAESAKYAAISLPNLHFLREIRDYFGPDVSLLPLLHTWSLGVEEQFYIVFPLLLMLLFRHLAGRQSRIAAVSAIFIASLVAACAAVPSHSQEAFFLLPYRAWELMLGALLAMAGPVSVGRIWSHVLGFAGLILVLGPMACYSKNTPFPGAAALPPCVGAGLLIFSGSDPRSLVCRLLGCQPLVFTGRISYSVYLWHWPLLAFTKYHGPLDAWSGALVFAGSLVMGAVSWRWIEQPCRKPDFGTRRMVFAAWVVSCLLMIGFWHAARRSGGFSNRFSAEVVGVLESKNRGKAYRSNAEKNYRPEDARVHGAEGAIPDIAVWGDSHAQSLMPVLDALGKQSGQAIKHFGMNGVPPVIGATPSDKQHAEKVSAYTSGTLDLLCRDPSIKTVILISEWKPVYRNQEHARIHAFHERSFASPKEFEEYYLSQVSKTIRRLLDSGRTVVIVEPVPAAPFDVPDRFAKILSRGGEPEASVSPGDFHERHRAFIAAMNGLGASDRLLRVKPADKLIMDGRLLLWIGRKPLYADQYHLSEAGAFHIKDLLSVAFRR